MVEKIDNPEGRGVILAFAILIILGILIIILS